MQIENVGSAPQRSGWYHWVPAALIFFSNGAIYGTWAAQVPIIKANLGMSDADFGARLMAMGTGAVIAMIMSGWLLPRYGTSRLIKLGFAVFVGSMLALSTASSVYLFTIALLLFGASGGLMDVAMNAFAAECELRIGRPVMSSIHGMWNVGGLAGAGLAGLLLSYLGGPVQATLAAAILVLLMLLVRSRLSLSASQPRESASRVLQRGKYVLAMGVLAILCFSAEGSVRDWSSLYLHDEIHLPLSLAAWGYAVFSALMAAGRLIGDQGRRRWGDSAMIVASGLVSAVGFYLATASSNTMMIFISFALIGAGLSNIVPTLVSAAGRLPNSRGSITVVVAMGYSGYLASPPLLGLIVSATSLGVMFQSIGAACLLIACQSARNRGSDSILMKLDG